LLIFIELAFYLEYNAWLATIERQRFTNTSHGNGSSSAHPQDSFWQPGDSSGPAVS